MLNFRTHCKYAIKHSIADIKDIVEAAKKDGDKSVAILDKNNLHSTIYLVKECNEHGLKPIIGFESEFLPSVSFWAKDNESLKKLNILSTLFSKGWFELKSSHIEGMFVISQNPDNLPHILQLTDAKNVFLEIAVNNPISTEKIEKYRSKAKEYGVKIIPTSEVLYNTRADAIGHDYFHNYVHGDNQHMDTDDYFIKSLENFRDYKVFTQEELEQPNKIAEQINLKVELGVLRLPAFDKIPEGETVESHLQNLCRSKLHELRLTKGWVGSDIYEVRLEDELEAIGSANLQSYFLIVKDICDHALSQGIEKGPGRGSAAGSLTCMLLGITDIDPMKYDLIFERFYNAGRKGSLPDIDTDFEAERRDEIVQYIKDRWGHDRVFQIITFGGLGPKKAIKSAMSLAQCSFEEQNNVTDMVWHKAESIDDAIAHSKKLKEESERRKLLFNVAKQYEGAYESFGKHAAGVIIAKEPYMDGGLPMTWHADDEDYISGFDLGAVEAFGLLKMDILGLNTLNIEKRAQELIRKRHNPDFHLRKIPLDDKEVYENIFHTGRTKGVFQLESQLGQRYSELLKPNSISEIADLVTVVRPGAMEPGQTDQYLKVRGGQPATYPHPKLEEVLKDTYSACIYQEQVIKLCQVMAGMDLQKADKVRAAAGKKKKKDMDAMQSEFVNGCLKEGHSKELADLLWSWIVKFSGYGFNKSHAVCYAYTAYETAYLKYHYPTEFYEASCNYVKGDLHRSEFEKLKELINDAKLMDVHITLPDIRVGNKRFEITADKKIVYGLTMIKGVGEASADEIMKCKDCKTFTEFLSKSYEIGLKKNVVEGLICSGALDGFRITRNQMLADFLLLQEMTEREVSELMKNIQTDSEMTIAKIIAVMCDEANVDSRKAAKLIVPNIKRRGKLREILNEYKAKDKYETIFHLAMHEREYLGLDISVNEADGVIAAVTHNCLEIKSLPKKTKVRTVVHLEKIKEIVTKKGANPGQEMAFLTAGDGTYMLDNIVVFPSQYSRFKDVLKPGRVIFIDGAIGDTGGLIANSIGVLK